MLQTGIVLDESFELHDTGPGHPERPGRLRAVREALVASGLADRCEAVNVELASDELLTSVHDEAYVGRVEAACAAGESVIDSMDTVVCPDSARIARLAAGSVTALARRVARGELRNG